MLPLVRLAKDSDITLSTYAYHCFIFIVVITTRTIHTRTETGRYIRKVMKYMEQVVTCR